MTVSARILQWTVPTPRGLWYRAFVVTPKGVFLTAEIDVTSMQAISEAANAVDGSAEGWASLRKALATKRFKQPTFVPLGEITGISRNVTGGWIDLVSESDTTRARVPNRDQLAEVADALSVAVKAARAAAA